MRTDAQVNNEIARLTAAVKNHRLDRETRWLLMERIKVLSLRLTTDQVKERYQTTNHDDDWLVLDAVARWLAEEEGYDPPSKGIRP